MFEKPKWQDLLSPLLSEPDRQCPCGWAVEKQLAFIVYVISWWKSFFYIYRVRQLGQHLWAQFIVMRLVNVT